MIAPLLVGLALWRGQQIVVVAVLLAALRYPGPAVLGLTAWIVISRMRRVAQVARPDDEARVLDRLMSELDGGASPRAAVAAASRLGGPVDLAPARRRIEAGLPAPDVAAALRDALPHNGRLIAAAWALAADAGAPAGPVMSLLARRAAERGRLDRERRALTAQARATAWLIAGLPLAVCAVLAATGRLGAGPGLPLVAAGAALQVVGVWIVVLMMRRAE